MDEFKDIKKGAKSSDGVLVKAASKLLYIDNNKKAGIILLGGISIGALLYRTYQCLPSVHSSIPTEMNNFNRQAECLPSVG